MDVLCLLMCSLYNQTPETITTSLSCVVHSPTWLDHMQLMYWKQSFKQLASCYSQQLHLANWYQLKMGLFPVLLSSTKNDTLNSEPICKLVEKDRFMHSTLTLLHFRFSLHFHSLSNKEVLVSWLSSSKQLIAVQCLLYTVAIYFHIILLFL